MDKYVSFISIKLMRSLIKKNVSAKHVVCKVKVLYDRRRVQSAHTSYHRMRASSHLFIVHSEHTMNAKHATATTPYQLEPNAIRILGVPTAKWYTYTVASHRSEIPYVQLLAVCSHWVHGARCGLYVREGGEELRLGDGIAVIRAVFISPSHLFFYFVFT